MTALVKVIAFRTGFNKQHVNCGIINNTEVLSGGTIWRVKSCDFNNRVNKFDMLHNRNLKVKKWIQRQTRFVQKQPLDCDRVWITNGVFFWLKSAGQLNFSDYSLPLLWAFYSHLSLQKQCSSLELFICHGHSCLSSLLTQVCGVAELFPCIRSPLGITEPCGAFKTEPICPNRSSWECK